MARMPSTLGERAVPRATRRIASFDPSAGLSATRRGAAAVGEGLDDISKGLQAGAEVLYEEQLKDEERAVKNLEVEWSKKRREILFGDGTSNKPGFFSTAGEDTLNARPNVEAELNKARSLILGKAKGARVRQAFDLLSTSSLQGELEQVDRYTIGQRREANTATAKASIDEAIQQAATYFSDEGKWKAAVDRIAFETAAMGDNEGWSQEVINNTTQKFISEAAKDRVRRALLTDAASGEAAYMQSRDMIDGDMRIEIEQDIKAAKKAEDVERRLAESERRQAIADADDAAFNDHATAILTGKADPKAIALDPRLSGRSKFALANALDSQTNAEQKTDYGLFNNLFSRIHLPEGHPDKINDWHDLVQFQPSFKFSDFEALRQEVEKVGTEEGKTESALVGRVLDEAKGRLSGKNDLLGLRDPKGEQLVTQATFEVLKAIEAGKKAGKTVYEMTDPTSPSYVGKVIDRLQRSPAQMMQDLFSESESLNTLTPDEATPTGPGARAVQPAGDVPVVSTPADYDKLPSGAKYRKPGDPETTVRTKK
jgi:hypothetical protein